MYRTHDEDRNAQSSESEPPEDGCESNDTNSGNPQEESQGRNENTAAPLHTRILGRILRNNQLLQIDQAQPTTGFDVMNDVRSRWRRNTVASPLGTERISLFRSPAPPFQRVRLSSSTTGLPDIGHGSSPSPQILRYFFLISHYELLCIKSTQQYLKFQIATLPYQSRLRKMIMITPVLVFRSQKFVEYAILYSIVWNKIWPSWFGCERKPLIFLMTLVFLIQIRRATWNFFHQVSNLNI